MGTILDSTKELSKKLGVEAEEQTIKDQIDAINESIDENFGGSVDIAEAVRTYSENAGGGGGGGATLPFMGMRLPQSLTPGQGTNTYGMILLNPNDEGTVFTLDGVNGNPSGPQYIIEPVKKINSKAVQYRPSTTIRFTPDQNFDGIYAMIVADGEEGTDYDTKLTLTGATITPGDGMVYTVSIDYDGATSSVTVYKSDTTGVMVPFPISE